MRSLAFVVLLLAVGAQAQGARLLVGPVLEQGGEGVVLTMGGDYAKACPVGPGSGEEVRGLLLRELERQGRWEILAVQPEGPKGDPLEGARVEGVRLGADLVLVGALYCWREREGGALGVERPAEVSLELILLRVRDGRVLWRALLQERQRPLSEDLFGIGRFLRKGFKWLTVRELTEALLEEAMRGMPESP